MILGMTVLLADMKLTLHTSRGLLLWCHAGMSLQFAHVHFSAATGFSKNARFSKKFNRSEKH